MLENLVKKYGQIWRTDQVATQVIHWKDMMSSKKKFNLEIIANFRPRGNDDDKTKHFPIEILQNKAIRDQNCFGTQMQTFQLKCNTINFNLKPDPQKKNTHSNEPCN